MSCMRDSVHRARSTGKCKANYLPSNAQNLRKVQRLLFELLWHPAASWHPQQSGILWKGHISEWLSHLVLQNKAKLKGFMSSPGEVAAKIRIKSRRIPAGCPLLMLVLWELWPHCHPMNSPLAFLHTLLLFHRRFLQVCMVCSCWTLHDCPQPFFSFVLPQDFFCVPFVNQYLSWVRIWWWERMIFPW